MSDSIVKEEADFDQIDAVIRAKSPELRLNSRMTVCVQATLKPPVPDDFYEIDPPDANPPIIPLADRAAATRRAMKDADGKFKDLCKLIEEGYTIAEQLNECIPYMSSHQMTAEALAQRVSDCSAAVWDEVLVTSSQNVPIAQVESSMKKLMAVNTEILQVFERMAFAEYGMSRMLNSNEDMYTLVDLEERLEKALDQTKASIAGHIPNTSSLEPLDSALKLPETEDPDNLGQSSESDRISSPVSQLRRGLDEYDITSEPQSPSQVL